MGSIHTDDRSSDDRRDDGPTPLRRQYLQLKRRFPDSILLFRLGDFYEAFDDDARVLSSELAIVLTGREVARGQRIPMAGIPYHSLDTHLARLVKKGFRVAVCEQLSDPRTSKGLVERDVTRVITPGTVVEPAMLDEGRNNYLAAVVSDGREVGLSYADVSTGEFFTTQFVHDESATLRRELERLAPAEILIPADDPLTSDDLFPASAGRVSTLDAWHAELSTAREFLGRHFEVASLEGFGLANRALAVRAAGALLHYLADTRKSALSQLSEPRSYFTSDYMLLDPATRRNLELTETARSGANRGSLTWVLDQTRTPGGARLLRAWLNQPLLDLKRLSERLETVDELVADTPGRARLRDQLVRVRDLERLINRIGQGLAGPRDLLALKASLEAVPSLRDILMPSGIATDHLPGRRAIAADLDDCPNVVELIGQAIEADPPSSLSDGGVIAPGFSRELDDLRDSSSHARDWIAGLEATERERTGIRGLKVGYNRVFGYFIEVSNANRGVVPDSYLRKQTLVGAERYVTPELKEYEAIVLNAKERAVEIEQALFHQICSQIAADRERVLRAARAISLADAVASLAEVAVQNRFSRPVLDDGTTIDIVQGRHAVVELARPDEPFTPNDTRLSCDDAQIVLLTGPNMAGKSTYLRQVALIVLLAQIGSYVPAESARVGLVDRIFTRVGAQDDLSAGQSTFLVEMLETAQLLTQSTRRSLLVLDEVGRGTSTYDGLAIAQAIVEYIHNHPRLGARTLFATHYHELTELANVLPRVRNFRMDVVEEGNNVHFLHRVVPGGADRSYGIHVARLAGIPRAVTRRAEEILRELERHDHRRGRRREPEVEVIQLSMLGELNPAIDELKDLDVLSLTPIEAIGKLFELQQKAKESS
ncbi:MAG: DNA mismatch repair protein MutS [Chloroflexota bacterium]